MEVWVNLKFGDGDFERGFSQIKIQIDTFSTQTNLRELETQLSPAQEIPNSYERWKESYDLLTQLPKRGFKKDQITNISTDTCLKYTKSLLSKLNQWLLPIKSQLEPVITSDTRYDIRLVVNTHAVTSESAKKILHHLPWQECNLFGEHSSLELALSFKDSLLSTREAIKPKSEIFRRIKIISILGNNKTIYPSTGEELIIQLDTDKELIIQLEKRGGYTKFLKEPKREELHTLWDEPCDILFFSGHSESLEDGKKGIIHINANEKLDLEEIPKTLTSAINQGLQLAIFNSCDGLGLARRLADLNLPYVIVWREPVPDKTAHKFLKFFLSSYSSGDSLFTAMWKARGKLQELTDSEKEKLLPGVSSLPIICKNTLELPPRWEDLGGLSGKLPQCPYKDLFAFGEEDAPFFFGREKSVDQLVAAVQSKSFVPVVGASGSGKSSVVFAGLVPHLRKTENVEIIDFRPGNNPLGNLAIALKNHCEKNYSHLSAPLQGENSTPMQRRLDEMILEVDLRHDEARLTQIIENIITSPGATKKLVLIADQFEELYTLTPQEERQPFLDALIYAIYHAPRFTLVLTLRADFYGYALSYRPFSDALQKGIYNLGPMNREELRCAIEKPAHKWKIKLESGLTDTLMKALGDEPGRLPLLEFTLTQLWQKPRKGVLTHEGYQEIGGLEKALANYADTVLDKLSQDEKKQAEKIFIQLICPGEGTEDTRRLATRPEVGEANWNLVQQLASERLLVTGYDETSENKSETVEIIHEALIREWGTFNKWIQDNREFRTWQERLRGAMRQWEETQQDEGALLRGAALVEAEERLKERRDDLSQDEQDYIQQSIELRERLIKQENERRKRQLLTASIVTMFFAGLSIFSGFQWRNSEINSIDSLTESSEALLVSNKKLDALISSLHAGKKLNQPLLQIFPQTTDLKDKVKRTLQKVVYHVQERNRLDGNSNIGVSFISDNQHLITARDGTIKLWNFQGQQWLTWPKKLPNINSISISPNGQIVATFEKDGNITLWDLKGQQLFNWKGNQGWKGWIGDISFSPNGQLLATAGSDGTRLWNLQGQLLAELESDQGWVWSVRFSPNGQLLATAGSDGTRLWNLQGQQLAKFTGENVRSVSFSPDGQKLATAGDDGKVRLWNLHSKQLINQWQENQRGVWFVSFSPDGQKLVIGNHNSTAYLRDLQGNELSKFTHLKGAIKGMSFSLDGKRLATAGDDDSVYLWDLQGKQLSEFVQHQGRVRKVSFSSDGQRLATVGDGTIRWWNLQGQELKVIKGHLVSFSQDGKQTATAEDDGTVSLWDFQGKRLFKFTAHQGQVRQVSFSSDGQRLATVGDDRIIRLWNLQGQKLFQSPVLADINFNLISLSFSPDTRLLAAITNEGSVNVWNLQGQKLVQSPILTDVNSHFERLIFSPNSRLLAAVANSGLVNVWDLQSGKKIDLLGHSNGTSGVIFYSDSLQLATTGGDGIVRLWDLQGKELFKFTAHQGSARSLSLSPNDQQLATTGDDGTVRLWNFRGQQLAEFPANSRNVIFSPDGQQLVTLGVDDTAKLWQIETFEELLKRGCGWVRDYLKNNPNVSKSDRTLCNQ